MKKIKKETNTLAIFYGITPSKLFRLLKNLEEEVRCSMVCDMPSAEAITKLSYHMDTEKSFLKIYEKDLALRKGQGKI